MTRHFGAIDPRLQARLRRGKAFMYMRDYRAIPHNRFALPTVRQAAMDAALEFRIDDAFRIAPPRD